MKVESGDGGGLPAPRRKRSGVKYLVVGLVLALEIFAALYLYTNPGAASQVPFLGPVPTSSTTASTTSTTTRTVIPDKIQVKSAVFENDTLMMDVHNVGPNGTSSLTISSVCTPGFRSCFSYKSLSGSAYQATFVLPAGKSFPENLTGVCAVAIANCGKYLPVANGTYYLQLNFTFTDRSVVSVPVTVMGNSTWSERPTGVIGVGLPSLTVNGSDFFGQLNVTVTANDSLPYASWDTKLDLYSAATDSFSDGVLTNSTGCAGSPPSGVNFKSNGKLLNVTYIADCSQPVFVIVPYTTVQTGVSVGSYYLVSVCDTTQISYPSGYPDNGGSHGLACFAVWAEATVLKG